MNKTRVPKHLKRRLLVPPPKEITITPKLLAFNFKQMDYSQGQSATDWAKEDLLGPLIERLRGLSSMTLEEAKNSGSNVFNYYDTFPPADRTDFSYPHHISRDAAWCGFHVSGRVCVIGHLVDDHVVYLVFLDKDHRFWIVDKKNT